MSTNMTRRIDYLKWSKWLGILTLVLCSAVIIWGWANGDFNSTESFQTYIKGFGFLGPCILILVQAFQVIFPILPGFAGCIVGSLLFSWLGGFVCNYVGICAGSIIAFLLAKRFGSTAVEKLVPVQKYERWTKRATNSKCYAWLLFLCILLPLAPDDYLCYLSGLMKMSSKKFVSIILLAKPWCILVYCIFTGYFI